MLIVLVKANTFVHLRPPGFPSSRPEMERVADIFDKDGDGYINYKEFVSALRPDRDVSIIY